MRENGDVCAFALSLHTRQPALLLQLFHLHCVCVCDERGDVHIFPRSSTAIQPDALNNSTRKLKSQLQEWS